MLERTSLLLSAWTPAPRDAPGGWSRTVHDAAAGSYLGRVRPASPQGWSWITWFRPLRLEALETDDDALLCTLIRSWGLVRSWELFDAEERRVGSLYPPMLLDSEGYRRGYTQFETPTLGHFIAPSGPRLARFEITEAHTLRLDFAADLEPNPFLRMLLFSAAATLQPTPLDG